MTEEKEHLQALNDIRSMMERSSRFISLSGLSGVFAGLFALGGAYIGAKYIEHVDEIEWSYNRNGVIAFYVFDALLVLFASVAVGILLTIRNSKKRGIKIWDNTAKRMLINLMIPLVSGGLFCIALLYHGVIGLVAPATLIFYGLALINASKYTFNDIRYLGICEIILGVISSFFIGYGLLCWAIGFGVLHIVYGAVMYFKYERNS
jgi:hypothetical protein